MTYCIRIPIVGYVEKSIEVPAPEGEEPYSGEEVLEMLKDGGDIDIDFCTNDIAHWTLLGPSDEFPAHYDEHYDVVTRPEVLED